MTGTHCPINSQPGTRAFCFTHVIEHTSNFSRQSGQASQYLSLEASLAHTEGAIDTQGAHRHWVAASSQIQTCLLQTNTQTGSAPWQPQQASARHSTLRTAHTNNLPDPFVVPADDTCLAFRARWPHSIPPLPANPQCCSFPAQPSQELEAGGSCQPHSHHSQGWEAAAALAVGEGLVLLLLLGLAALTALLVQGAVVLLVELLVLGAVALLLQVDLGEGVEV